MSKNISIKSKKQIVIHPFLFAIFPILSLFGYNISSVSFDQIVIPLSLSIFITFLIWIALGKVLKNKIKAGFITSLGLIMFFFYGHIYMLIDEFQKDVFSHFFLLIPWLILIGLGSYYFIKTKRLLDKATFIVNIIAITLVIISFASIIDFLISENIPDNTNEVPIEKSIQVVNTDNLPDNTNEVPIEKSIQVVNTDNLPDIYYIIPDAYAGSKSLQMVHNYDNSEFTNFLQNKGFYVSEESFSNYRYTLWSLPATLNMKYINYVAEDKAADSKDYNVLRKLAQNSEVFQYLKSLGYTIVAIEGGETQLKHSKLVDLHLCGSGKYPEEFDIILIRTTMLESIHVELFGGIAREQRLCTFSELIKTTELDSKPKFVLAHIILPHPPYVFGADGEVVIKNLSLVDKKHYWLYLDQLKFTNKKIQEVVEKLTTTDSPPIIIIQSDHGMRSGPITGKHDFYFKYFNNFNAYYFPDKGRNVEFETTTPVNSFRVLFNLYFDEDYELLEDKIYYNPNDRFYDLTDVTEILIKN